jgi:endonuclease/exonuclease/phosphatase family metal-dependent hydrolase
LQTINTYNVHRIFVVIFLTLCVNCVDAQSTGRVMFYNVENLMDTINNPLTNDDEFTPDSAMHWNSKRYYTKLEMVSRVIVSATDSTSPIAIGLAEIENEQVLQDLIGQSKMQGKSWGIVHHDSPDKRGIDVALIYNKALFKILEEQFIPVEFPFDSTLTTRDILYVKGALADSTILHLFVAHFPSRREGKTKTEERRTRAAFILRQKAEQVLLADKNANIIIMGDFNDNPKDKAPLITTFDIALTNLMVSKKDSGEYTLTASGSKFVYDHIIVSNNLLRPNALISIAHNKAEIYKPEWLLFNHPKHGLIPNRTYVGTKYTGGYSDHLPVYIDLEFK